MRSLFQMMTSSFLLLRRGLSFWVASFGELPGLTRDLALPVAHELCAKDPAHETQVLADEMHWGLCLRSSTLPALRVSM